MLVGIILVAASVWWVAQGSAAYLGRSGVQDIIAVINGVIPPLLFIMGLFVVWLEVDELKASVKKRK